MTKEEILKKRSDEKCEMCLSTAGGDTNSETNTGLSVYEVPPSVDRGADGCVLLCTTCLEQINSPEILNENHWRSLAQSMWSEFPAVQVVAWRMLKRLSDHSWAQDLLEQFFLDEEIQKWAETFERVDENNNPETKDSNGTKLLEGDTVTLIKDLDVKGAKFTAKRGTTIKNIHLTENPEQIEGRVNGTQIVLLTKFLKKV